MFQLVQFFSFTQAQNQTSNSLQLITVSEITMSVSLPCRSRLMAGISRSSRELLFFQ